MKMLYTANGRYIRCFTEEGTRPVIIVCEKEYEVDVQEFMLWSILNWRILREEEISSFYEKMASSSNVTMHDIPLNDTQRIFAEKNHNLVYKFLHEKNLPASEYYDIVIFGYLRAVQRYLTDPNLAGYSFATVAWRAMEGEVVNTHRTDKRRFRVIRFVRPRQSYTGHLTRRPTPTETDEEALRESEVALLLHALAKRVTPQQMEIIRLRTKGYQTNEIAQMQNTSLYHVNTLLDNARFIVVELCRDA